MIRRFARKHALLIVFITLFMTALSTTSLYLAGIILNFPEDIDPEPTVNLIPPLKLNASVGDTAHLSMVYTWVNGSDSSYQALKESLGGNGRLTMEDRNIDELLFSLRSVEENLPWFEGEIYIVSPPGHIPSWLNISHPRVRMVNQNTLLPTDAQPTCNSFLIEFYLDQIVGLTETFIYMNDDFFFARPISPSRFFDDQVQTNWGVGAKIYPANPGRTTFSRRDAERMARLMDRKARLVGGARDRFHLPIWRASDGWTRAVCTEKFKTGTNSLRHFPYIWHKQVLSWVREVVRSDLQRMFDHKFRNQRDLQAPSLLFGAYHHLEEFYGVTLFSEVPHEDSARFTAGGGCYDNKITREKEFEWLRKGGFEMFNLNTDYNRVPSGEACREFLEDLFGSPSSFEWKADGIAPTGTVDL